MLLVFIIILATTAVSDNPDRVVINLVHLVFGALAAWLYFTHEARKANPVRSAALIVFYSLMFVQVASIVWFIAHPDGTINSIIDGQRQGGISGNPNIFGGVCIAACWSTLTLIFTQTERKITNVFWIVPIAVVSFNLWTTGSASSQGIAVIMALLFVTNSVFFSLNRTTQLAVVFLSVGAFFGAIFWFVFQQNILTVAESATGSVGKDITFTGRIDLWLVALEAIAERPWLGWSFDNHETVKGNPLYFQRYNHYHNGFLDTLIVGGFILGIAVLYSFFKFGSRAISISAFGTNFSPLVLGVLAACLQNLTEYSMFRSNSTVWTLYFVCFISVAVVYFDEMEPSTGRRYLRKAKGRAKGSSRGSGRRYAW